MLAWIIASPNCNHWPEITRAISLWRRRKPSEKASEYRRQRHRRFNQVIIDPSSEEAANWANPLGITAAKEGQPDVIFFCHRHLADREHAQRLIRRFNPGRIVRVSGMGQLETVEIHRAPAAPSGP